MAKSKRNPITRNFIPAMTHAEKKLVEKIGRLIEDHYRFNEVITPQINQDTLTCTSSRPCPNNFVCLGNACVEPSNPYVPINKIKDKGIIDAGSDPNDDIIIIDDPIHPGQEEQAEIDKINKKNEGLFKKSK